MSETEPDYHNFSQSSSAAHRLPTLNGAQALFNVIEKQQPISTSLQTLDSILSDNEALLSSGGGVHRGSVTEIYGPPGCGKTHFAIQLVANVLRSRSNAKAVWIDTASELSYPRLEAFLDAPTQAAEADDKPSDTPEKDKPELSMDERLNYFYISDLTHLLSLLLHSANNFIPDGTAILVVDDFSGIVMNGLPQDERITSQYAKDDQPSLSRDDIISKSIAARRATVLSAISAGLARLAATKNLAVVVLNKATSNRKYDSKNATLRSVLSSQQWNENVATRLALYRIFWPRVDWSRLDKKAKRKQRRRETHALRIAEIERLGSKDVYAEGVKFVILSNRLQAVEPPKNIEVADVALPSSPPLLEEDNEEAMGNLGLEDGVEDEDKSAQMPEDVPASSVPPNSSQPFKRKVAEIADSEDEDEEPVQARVRLSPMSPITTGFLPSSQIRQDEDESETAEIRSPQCRSDNREDEENEDDDMLLRD